MLAIPQHRNYGFAFDVTYFPGLLNGDFNMHHDKNFTMYIYVHFEKIPTSIYGCFSFDFSGFKPDYKLFVSFLYMTL